jgi:hypothetical protein
MSRIDAHEFHRWARAQRARAMLALLKRAASAARGRFLSLRASWPAYG